MHMLSKQDFTSDEMNTLRRSRTTTVVEDNYLKHGQLRTFCRTRIITIFQQQLGFYIKTKGSVKIFR